MNAVPQANTQTRTSDDHRGDNSPSTSATGGNVTISGGAIISALLAFSALTAVAVAFLALGRTDNAVEETRKVEREFRIMQDDLKFQRAYLSARGISIPANHEEAEEK